MTKYEYMMGVKNVGNTTDHSDAVVWLNELGSEGWQCVDVRFAPVSQYNIYTFMRPVQPVIAVDAEEH